MSWDIFVQDLPADARAITDIPDDFAPAPLGPRAELIRRIQSYVPGADFADPAWGQFTTPELSVEFNLGEDDLVRSFALHVHGGDAAPAFVADLLSYLGFRALDPESDSGLFEPGDVAQHSFRRWREYRDRVLSRGAP